MSRSLSAATLLFALAAGTAHAAGPGPVIAPIDRNMIVAGIEDFATANAEALARAANECLVTAIAAVAMTALVPASAGPMTVMALGGVPGASPFAAAAVGCGAGVAMTAASEGLNQAWEDREAIGNAAIAQARYAWNTGATAVATVAGALGDPTTTVAGMLEQGQSAMTALASTAAGLTGWWQDPPAVDDGTIDVAGIGDEVYGSVPRMLY